MAEILKGAPVAAALSESVRSEVDELKAQGIVLEDTPAGVKWHRA